MSKTTESHQPLLSPRLEQTLDGRIICFPEEGDHALLLGDQGVDPGGLGVEEVGDPLLLIPLWKPDGKDSEEIVVNLRLVWPDST